jgi:hypothetical protein
MTCSFSIEWGTHIKQQKVRMKKSIFRTNFLSPGALSGENKYAFSVEDDMTAYL